MRLILFFLLLTQSSCWMVRAYRVRHLRLTDHEKHPFVLIKKSPTPFRFMAPSNPDEQTQFVSLVDSLIENTETAAFLVIRNDTLLYEKYFDKFTERSLLPSNSVAKSFTGTLVAIALRQGKIKSEHEPITKYIPELGARDARFHNIKIRHLLDMRAGFDFTEGKYNLSDDAVKLGFKRDLVKHLLKVEIREAPGKFDYQSISTQLLGVVIERATDEKLQDYFEREFWMRVGAEQDATWNVDSKKRKHVLTSAGLNATARDFAKIGRLYLANGSLSGQQLISPGWVHTVSSFDTMSKYDGYKSQWWNKKSGAIQYGPSSSGVEDDSGRHTYTLPHPTRAFNAYGFMQQIIYVHPDKNVIIVRFGRGWPEGRHFLQMVYELGERL